MGGLWEPAGPHAPPQLCFPASRTLLRPCCWLRLPVKFSLEPGGPGCHAELTHACRDFLPGSRLVWGHRPPLGVSQFPSGNQPNCPHVAEV